MKSRFVLRSGDSTRHLIQHIDYMMKSKIDREKEPETRKLFDREGREITREEGIELALKNQGSEIAGHKLILSAGDNTVDMVDYTRDQMRVLEERFNARIDYTFSYQRNTDHHHIHVTLPGTAERRFDLGSEPLSKKVDIQLDISDFEAMRAAGVKYLAEHSFRDLLTDKRFNEELHRDSFEEERGLEQGYNKMAWRELHLGLSDYDRAALRDLGIGLPEREVEDQKPKRRFRKAPERELGSKEFGEEFARYLADRKPFEDEWSDRDVARILDTSERDPEWIFSNAYKVEKKHKEDRFLAIQSVKGDERFKQFARGVETSIALEKVEHVADNQRLGISKKEFSSDHNDLERFFGSERGERIYEIFTRLQQSLKDKDGRDVELFSDLNSSVDLHLTEKIQSLSEKFDKRMFGFSDEMSPIDKGMDSVQSMKDRVVSIKHLSRILGYKSSGNFTDSFERLIRLEEGAQSIPKFENADMRTAFLAEKLMQPEYEEHRNHLDLLKERSFNLYSRFSTREDTSETKQEIRDSQFALDAKLLNLIDQRSAEQRFELDAEGRQKDFGERSSNSQSRHEINAQNFGEVYREALKNENQIGASDAAQKFHASVIKVDDERLRDEDALTPDYGEAKDHALPVGDMRQSVEGPERDSLQEYGLEPAFPGGPSLPLPGYGLERLERDPGDSMPDPSEIQVELTRDEMERRGHEDDEHHGRLS